MCVSCFAGCLAMVVRLKHNIPKDKRQLLMQHFKDVLYSTSEGQVKDCYKILIDSCTGLQTDEFLRYVQNLMKRRDQWCLADRQQVLTRGNRTNNISEATIRILKENVFKRCKAYNACQVVHMVVEVLSPYLQARILNLALNRAPTFPVRRQLLPKEKITKICDVQYRVASETTDDANYVVDMDCGKCSCSDGICGRTCKHYHSVTVHFFLESDYYYHATAEERHKLACVAVGEERAGDKVFLESLQSYAKEVKAVITPVPHSNSSHDSVATPIVEDTTNNTANHSQNVLEENNGNASRSQLAAENNCIIANIARMIKDNVDVTSQEANEALKKYQAWLVKVTTSNQMYSILHTLPSQSLPQQNSGKRIQVQPGLLQRRRKSAPRCAAPLPKRRSPLSALPGPAAKRKRYLACNVQLTKATPNLTDSV